MADSWKGRNKRQTHYRKSKGLLFDFTTNNGYETAFCATLIFPQYSSLENWYCTIRIHVQEREHEAGQTAWSIPKKVALKQQRTDDGVNEIIKDIKDGVEISSLAAVRAPLKAAINLST